MSRHRSSSVEGKVYVGDLPPDASEKELERAFNYYGHLRNVWVARNPPGFAFVEFEDYRDAEDAVRALDGTVICGNRVRVEPSSGKVRPKPWMRGGRGPPRSRKAFHPEDRCYECGDRGHYAYDCYKYRRGGRRSSRRHCNLAIKTIMTSCVHHLEFFASVWDSTLDSNQLAT